MNQPTTHTSAGTPIGGGTAINIPRINIQAFCETPQTAATVETAFADRRMARAHGSVHPGGIAAAVSMFQAQSTPNLLLVESTGARDALIPELAGLAEVCQPDTKVVVIGQVNDVLLYRELIRQGVSEYIVAPGDPLHLIEVIAGLYRSEKAQPVGKIMAFLSAKGGAGSSTIAHNCAWHISRAAQSETAIVDMDVAFGTAALHFNAESGTGLVDALSQPERVDALLLDRLLIRLEEKLSLLSGPGGLDRDVHIEAHAVETVLSALRVNIPIVVVDVPHRWTPWAKFILLHADQVVLTAEPELASLRNAKYLVDQLREGRPNDPPPRLILNRVGVPKRPEISVADFRKTLGIEVSAVIPHDPQLFLAALNNGKMLLEMSPKSKPAEVLRDLADTLGGIDKTARKPAARPSLLSKLTSRGKS